MTKTSMDLLIYNRYLKIKKSLHGPSISRGGGVSHRSPISSSLIPADSSLYFALLHEYSLVQIREYPIKQPLISFKCCLGDDAPQLRRDAVAAPAGSWANVADVGPASSRRCGIPEQLSLGLTHICGRGGGGGG